MEYSDNLINTLDKIRIGSISVGLVGNILSFFVFSRKSFRRNSINVYFRALAISDSIIIIVQLVGDIARLTANIDLYSPINELCKLTYYIYTIISPISGWILATFAIDKAISVVCINRFRFIQKRSFQLAIIALIVLINSLIYIEIPIALNNFKYTSRINGTNSTTTIYICWLDSISFIRVINYVFLVQSSCIPFIIMLGATIIISKTLYSSRSRLTAQCNNQHKSRRMRDRKFAVTSAVFNVLYVIFQSPVTFSYVLRFPDAYKNLIFYLICIIFYNLNFSISFFVYLISNSIFRRELFKMILSLKHSSSDVTITNQGRSDGVMMNRKAATSVI